MVADLHLRATQLQRALDEGLLPNEMVSLGSRLLTGLQRPTHITVFGMSGSGKTSILNMIIGSNAMPDLSDVSAVELTWGEIAEGHCESRTGEETSFDGVARAETVPPDTLRVVQRLPLDVLRDKRLVEINFTSVLGAGSEIIDWATQEADIAIWCTQSFNDRECAIWAQVPDRLKDNGFLALTHADRLQMQGTLNKHVEAFAESYADEFNGLFPVATLQAIAARTDSELVDPKRWKASGCKALSDAIDKIIDQAKRADADHAEVLLARANVDFSTPEETPADTNGPADAPHAPMGQCEAVETGLSILQQSADELATKNADALAPQEVLDHCAQTAQALATLFMDTESDDAEVCALRDDAINAEQMIQLFQLERSDKAAEDAVAVLLQLKKEMAEATQ